MNVLAKKLLSLISFVFFINTVPLFSICTQQPYVDISLRSGIEETDEYIEVTGLGAASADGVTTEAEAKRNSETIAYFQAVEILSEALQGIAVQGELKLRDLRISEGELIQLMKMNLKGVQRLGTTRFERQEDGSWLAACTVKFEKKNAESLAAGLRNSPLIEKGINDRLSETNPFYTGIIIDLRYIFGFSSLLAPKVISNDGRELFSIRDIDPDILMANYGVPVFSSIREAVDKPGGVGEFPLKLVPKEYDSESGSIMLSENDTKKFLQAPGKDSLIRKGKIALIL